MKNYIKLGFGFAVGYCLGKATVKMIARSIMKHGANDKEFMEYEKVHNPKLYEELKEYQTNNKTES